MTTVIKLGGKSNETVEKIYHNAGQIKEGFRGEKVYVVVSAMGNITDRTERYVGFARSGMWPSSTMLSSVIANDVYQEFFDARHALMHANGFF